MVITKSDLCSERLGVDQAVLFDLLVAQLTDFAIFVADCDGYVQSWNPGVERLLGYSEAQWLGQSLDIIFTPEDRSQNIPQEEIARSIAEGHAPDVRWHQRRDGSRLFIEGTMVGLRDDAGKLLGFAKVMRDITRRKVAEQENERLTRELQRSNEELVQFAHTVSHDLQTPLRGVMSYAQLLDRKAKTRLIAEDAELISHVVESARGMQHLVEALLTFAQVGKGEIDSKPVEMEVALSSALQRLASQIDEAKATIIHTALPIVEGDFAQLVQLLQNLIGNAIKYSCPGKPAHIQIEARKEKSHYLFAVQDDGQGIPSAYLQSIFEPLKRLHGREIPGTGLGLALCQRIVNRHGGNIWAESQVGIGSTFYFMLPTTLAKRSEAAPAVPASRYGEGSK